MKTSHITHHRRDSYWSNSGNHKMYEWMNEKRRVWCQPPIIMDIWWVAAVVATATANICGCRLPMAATAQRRQKKSTTQKSKGMWKEGMPANRNHGTHTHTLAVVEKCHGFLICEVLQGNQHNSVDVKGCANIFSMCKSSFNGVTLEKHCRNIEFRVHCRLMSCHKSNKIKPYCRCAFANCG